MKPAFIYQADQRHGTVFGDQSESGLWHGAIHHDLAGTAKIRQPVVSHAAEAIRPAADVCIANVEGKGDLQVAEARQPNTYSLTSRVSRSSAGGCRGLSPTAIIAGPRVIAISPNSGGQWCLSR